MDNYSEQFNELFQMGISGGNDSLEKLAAETSDYCKLKVREESWSQKILPQKPVDKEDLVPELDEDVFHTIEEVEPDSTAVVLNLRSQPEARQITGKRTKCEFFKVSTEKVEKSQTELLAYKMPITRILQENTVKDMYQKEDARFYTLSKKALELSHREAVANPTEKLSPYYDVVAPTDGYITKQDFISGMALHSRKGNFMEATVALMTKSRFFDILKWDSTVVGSEVAGNIAKKGWDDPMVLGIRTLVTNKSQTKAIPGTLAPIVGEYTSEFDDEIIFYSSPDYIGKNYILDKLHFYLEKKADIISWESWKVVGMVIQNINSVSMLRVDPTEIT